MLGVDIFAENDTIARIGTSCFQKLVESNVNKLSLSQWQQLTTAFVKLFKMTTPHQLFDESLRIELSDSSNTPDAPGNLLELLNTLRVLNYLNSVNLVGFITCPTYFRNSNTYGL
jgi:hypothetical protein